MPKREKEPFWVVRPKEFLGFDPYVVRAESRVMARMAYESDESIDHCKGEPDEIWLIEGPFAKRPKPLP